MKWVLFLTKSFFIHGYLFLNEREEMINSMWRTIHSKWLNISFHRTQLFVPCSVLLQPDEVPLVSQLLQVVHLSCVLVLEVLVCVLQLVFHSFWFATLLSSKKRSRFSDFICTKLAFNVFCNVVIIIITNLIIFSLLYHHYDTDI